MLTEAQLEMRRTGIGGSEIAALVGEDKFSSPFDVYLAKVEGWRKPTNPDMERGSFLEAGIAEWYAHRTGSVLLEMGAFIHPDNPVLRCTPDRFEAVTDETLRLVSIKAPRRSEGWGKDGTDEVPPGYLLQLQWEHAIVSRCALHLDPVMHLAALVDGDLRIYMVTSDPEIQGWLLEYAQSWWARHVVARVPPPLDGSSEAERWLRKRFPRDTQPIRPATPWEDVRMLELRDVEARADVLSEEADTLRLELMQSIGEAGGLESPAGRVTFRADKNGKRSFKTKWSKG